MPSFGVEKPSEVSDWKSFAYFQHAFEDVELPAEGKIAAFRLYIIELRHSRLSLLFGSAEAKTAFDSLSAPESLKYITEELKRLRVLYREDPDAGGDVRRRHLIEIDNLLTSAAAFDTLRGVAGGYMEVVVRSAGDERRHQASTSISKLIVELADETRAAAALEKIHSERGTIELEHNNTAEGRAKLTRVLTAAASTGAKFWEVRGTPFLMVTVTSAQNEDAALPIVVRESVQRSDIAFVGAKAIRLIKVPSP